MIPHDYVGEAQQAKLIRAEERDSVQREILACLQRIEKRLDALAPPESTTEPPAKDPKP